MGEATSGARGLFESALRKRGRFIYLPSISWDGIRAGRFHVYRIIGLVNGNYAWAGHPLRRRLGAIAKGEVRVWRPDSTDPEAWAELRRSVDLGREYGSLVLADGSVMEFLASSVSVRENEGDRYNSDIEGNVVIVHRTFSPREIAGVASQVRSALPRLQQKNPARLIRIGKMVNVVKPVKRRR